MPTEADLFRVASCNETVVPLVALRDAESRSISCFQSADASSFAMGDVWSAHDVDSPGSMTPAVTPSCEVVSTMCKHDVT